VFGLFKSTQSTDLPAGDFTLAWKKLKAHHDGLEEGKVIDYETNSTHLECFYHTVHGKNNFSSVESPGPIVLHRE
jgi:hypothetical protein